ncbi:MAG: 4-hydroxy-tetrahydrodipicolinate synthase [Myxococcales bacterium]|nr:4-hydroxy-tetrahydrodipicolinate synthase [Myxococcales bacterium]
MPSVRFEGTFTALVTPFAAEGIDWAALEQLVEDQLAGGVAGLVPCGTTGESPTLSREEQAAVIDRVVRLTRGRVPVIAGTGSNSTDATIRASTRARELGADGIMIVMPYYNKPAQEGLAAHCIAVAKSVDCPVVLYNIPGRSVVDLGLDATAKILECAPNVVAIKDASGNVLRCQDTVRRFGERVTVLSGDDALTLPMMACGARGVISVTANVLPREVSAVATHALVGDWAAARSAHLRLLALHGLMFVEPNPGPCKAALALVGKMKDGVRLPLMPATEATVLSLTVELARLGYTRDGRSS